jgi:hypothetical protein
VEGSQECCSIPRRCCLGLEAQAHCNTDLAQPLGPVCWSVPMAPKRRNGPTPPTNHQPHASRVSSPLLCTQLRCSWWAFLKLLACGVACAIPAEHCVDGAEQWCPRGALVEGNYWLHGGVFQGFGGGQGTHGFGLSLCTNRLRDRGLEE